MCVERNHGSGRFIMIRLFDMSHVFQVCGYFIAKKRAGWKSPTRRAISHLKGLLIVDSLESGYLYLLEERSSRGNTVDVQKRRVEHPITLWRTVYRA